MDDKAKLDLLKSIELSGSVDREVSLVTININKGLENILDFSSGRKRIRGMRATQFSLIVAKPAGLSALSSLEIRCLNCGRVISYPCWHLEVKFDRNIFEYFVCFSENSPNRVSLNCRRG